MKSFKIGKKVWFVYEIYSSLTTPPDQCLMVLPGYIIGVTAVADIGLEYNVQVTEEHFLKDCICMRTSHELFSSRKAAEKVLKLREQELLKERKAAFVELGRMLKQYKERRNGK